jgi:hypothetical protein
MGHYADDLEGSDDKARERAILGEMAQAAIPHDDADWGSERQVAAQNAFFNRVERLLVSYEFAELEHYCNKATTEEMIAEALRMVDTSRDVLHRDRFNLPDDVIEDALNAACLIIQKHLGVTDGGVAGQHFSGSGRENFEIALQEYATTEKHYAPELED